jgi:DNA-binding CsgD family transcriptional regulator
MRDRRRWFRAEIVEAAQAAGDVHDFRARAMPILECLVGCEGVFWQDPAAVVGPGYQVHSDADSLEFLRPAAERMVQRAARYRASLDRAVTATLRDGWAITTDLYTGREREFDCLWQEVIRPARISHCLNGTIEYRGQPTSIVGFVRLGTSRPFSSAEVQFARSLGRDIGLVETALWKSRARPPPAVTDPGLALTLTLRETEVAHLVAEGLSNKEVATRLGTSPDTVRKQTIRIYEKLCVSGRVQLARLLNARSDAL